MDGWKAKKKKTNNNKYFYMVLKLHFRHYYADHKQGNKTQPSKLSRDFLIPVQIGYLTTDLDLYAVGEHI